MLKNKAYDYSGVEKAPYHVTVSLKVILHTNEIHPRARSPVCVRVSFLTPSDVFCGSQIIHFNSKYSVHVGYVIYSDVFICISTSANKAVLDLQSVLMHTGYLENAGT